MRLACRGPGLRNLVSDALERVPRRTLAVMVMQVPNEGPGGDRDGDQRRRDQEAEHPVAALRECVRLVACLAKRHEDHRQQHQGAQREQQEDVLEDDVGRDVAGSSPAGRKT